MSVRKLLGAAALVAVVAGAAPAKASADWLFTPFVGINFGGSARFNEAGVPFDDEFKKKIESDEAFARNGHARLEFFARRHSSWDERWNLDPVLRTNAEPK